MNKFKKWLSKRIPRIAINVDTHLGMQMSTIDKHKSQKVKEKCNNIITYTLSNELESRTDFDR